MATLRAMRFASLIAAILGASPICDALAAPIEHADGQSVHRCIGEHGEITFSGFPCSSAHAASIEANGERGGAAIATGSPGSAGAVCPATLDALRDAIAAAFAQRDANMIAGIVRWDGVGGGAARERMRDLAAMTASPLLGIDIESDAPPDPRDANGMDRAPQDDDRYGDDRSRVNDGDARTASSDPRDAAPNERFASSDPRYGAHDGRESRVVSSDRGDGENDRLGDDEGVAPRPRKRAASFAPGIVAIRTGGETGARENDFRIEPDGGCYWLDW